MKLRPVIIGNSTAAVAAIEAIHLQDPGLSPVLISDEPLPPYSPMALLPLAQGAICQDDIFFRPPDFYRRNNVEAKLGKKAARIDAEKREVTLEGGEIVPFSKLLIAAGARAVLPPSPGLAESGAITIRRMADARLLKEQISGAKSACVVGAGLIGIEAAQCLLAKGIPAVVLELMPQILPAYMDPESASIVQRAFEAKGARFHLGCAKLSFQPSKVTRSTEVSIGGRPAIEADLIVAATGVAPRVELLRGTGIRINRGIIVDERMETSVPGIYAAGDIAEAPDFFTGENISNPILPAAAEQGEVAGINMAGGERKYLGSIRMNIFNFYGRVAFSVGDVRSRPGDDEITIRRGPDGYGKMILRGGALAGCLSVDMGLEPGIARAMVASREDFSAYRDRLAYDINTFSRAWMLKRRAKGEGASRRFSAVGKRTAPGETAPMPAGWSGRGRGH